MCYFEPIGEDGEMINLNFPMVTGFVLDSMHTIDIGVIRALLIRLFVSFPTKNLTNKKNVNVELLLKSKLNLVDNYVEDFLTKTWIKEPARSLRYFSKSGAKSGCA